MDWLWPKKVHLKLLEATIVVDVIIVVNVVVLVLIEVYLMLLETNIVVVFILLLIMLLLRFYLLLLILLCSIVVNMRSSWRLPLSLWMGGVGVHSHFRVKPPTTVEVTLWLNWGGDINNKTSILSLGIFVSLKEIGGSQFQSCREA